jgi:hypothetical protein
MCQHPDWLSASTSATAGKVTAVRVHQTAWAEVQQAGICGYHLVPCRLRPSLARCFQARPKPVFESTYTPAAITIATCDEQTCDAFWHALMITAPLAP